MSYDVRIGVKVDGTDIITKIARPELDSPTYNLRDMFVACMDWDYSQGEWYPMTFAIDKITHGLTELICSRKKYQKYNPANGWGNLGNAKDCLESWIDRVREIEEEIPIEHLWFRW